MIAAAAINEIPRNDWDGFYHWRHPPLFHHQSDLFAKFFYPLRTFMHRFDIFLEGNFLRRVFYDYEPQPVKISPVPLCFARIDEIISEQKTV